MATVVVSWDIILQVGRVKLGRWSSNGMTVSHYSGGYSAQSLLIHIMVLKCMCDMAQYLFYRGNVMTRLGHGF